MHGRQGCLVACVWMEPSVGKGLWTHQTQLDVAYRYRTHRTHRMQSPSQDATLRYLTQTTFLLMYALPWIIHHGAAGVRLTGAAPCHLVLVETQKVETLLFTCHLSAVRDQPRVPGPMLSSGISLSSASGSVSDLV